MTSNVHCPGCGGSQPKREPHSIYWWSRCRGQSDDVPDEGGD